MPEEKEFEVHFNWPTASEDFRGAPCAHLELATP